MWLIYTKHKTEKNFQPLQFHEKVGPNDFIYPRQWGSHQRHDASKLVRELKRENPEWEYELREEASMRIFIELCFQEEATRQDIYNYLQELIDNDSLCYEEL